MPLVSTPAPGEPAAATPEHRDGLPDPRDRSRGRGWASNAVAEVSRRSQANGNRVCLFTGQANPTSHKVYAALGYRPVVDMANLTLTYRGC